MLGIFRQARARSGSRAEAALFGLGRMLRVRGVTERDTSRDLPRRSRQSRLR